MNQTRICDNQSGKLSIYSLIGALVIALGVILIFCLTWQPTMAPTLHAHQPSVFPLSNMKLPAVVVSNAIHINETRCGENMKKWKKFHVKGLYHTGTNAISSYLTKNCLLNNIDINTNLNKLNMYNGSILINQLATKHKQLTVNEMKSYIANEQLMLIMIKDPLTWLKSVCKQLYDFSIHFNNITIDSGSEPFICQ